MRNTLKPELNNTINKQSFHNGHWNGFMLELYVINPLVNLIIESLMLSGVLI